MNLCHVLAVHTHCCFTLKMHLNKSWLSCWRRSDLQEPLLLQRDETNGLEHRLFLFESSALTTMPVHLSETIREDKR